VVAREDGPPPRTARFPRQEAIALGPRARLEVPPSGSSSRATRAAARRASGRAPRRSARRRRSPPRAARGRRGPRAVDERSRGGDPVEEQHAVRTAREGQDQALVRSDPARPRERVPARGPVVEAGGAMHRGGSVVRIEAIGRDRSLCRVSCGNLGADACGNGPGIASSSPSARLRPGRSAERS
jgi:hypothetical protein